MRPSAIATAALPGSSVPTLNPSTSTVESPLDLSCRSGNGSFIEERDNPVVCEHSNADTDSCRKRAATAALIRVPLAHGFLFPLLFMKKKTCLASLFK
ncbi:unnamed protein product [Gongylonema pulchrum]|uniref:Uncharacterized protein n=1 Tax=Gongylonema pulchrum TaxID=637853 RepID=A0A3P6T8N4_9BILA|nr:unnamed protein product [Gongylonema pulchrum]